MLRSTACLLIGVVLWLGVPPNCEGQGFGSGFARPSDNPAARYNVKGTVVNAVTGEPVRRALVQIFAGPGLTALTDSGGNFEFNGLPAMQASISARKPGFFSEQELNQSPFAAGTSTSQIGPGAGPVIIKLVPEGVIFGRIVSDNEPVEGLPVRVMTKRIVNGRPHWEPRGNAATDEDGEFHIANLTPGSYYLAVGPGRGRMRRAKSAKARDFGYTEVFYPGAPDVASATLIDIAPGQQFTADFSLKAQAVFRVSGEISGNNTEQQASVRFINGLGSDASNELRFEEDGKFQAKVPAGTYTIRAGAYGDASQPQLVASQVVVVNSDVERLQLALEPQLPIPVVIKVEATKAQNGMWRANTQAANVRLRPTERRLDGDREYWPGPVGQGKDKSFAIQNVDPGRYSVEVTPNGPWYVQSAQCGETDLLREDLTVAAGVQLPPIEVVLRDDSATLAGAVKGGDPTAGAAVILVPEKYPREATMAFAPPGGQFQFTGLEPGDYQLMAFDRVDELEYSNPEALAPYAGRATHVTVQPDERLTLSLQLIAIGK